MVRDVLVCTALRTPRGRGRPGGGLYAVKPAQLLAIVLAELAARNALDTSAVDDVVIGCVSPVGEQGANIAKTAAMLAGWHRNASGTQINRFCASGLEAVNMAAQKIRSGWEELVIAGGVESMSRVPMFSDGGAWQFDPQTSLLTDYVPQGIGADLIATLGGWDRATLDDVAIRSHRLADEAWNTGRFAASIVPVADELGQTLLARDENVRADASRETLAALKPVFDAIGRGGCDTIALRKYPEVARIEHDHTAGNSSAIVDGAAAVLLAGEVAVRDHGLTPRARVVAAAVTGSDPTIMLTGPAPAARKALRLAGLGFDDIDLFEVNEAFASVPLRFMADCDVPADKVNVSGGAIAMGHPLGATGAMLLGTLIDDLERLDLKRGMVTMCIGGGMGVATIVERL